MARFDQGWAQYPRRAIELTKKDPIGRALFATLCCWANVEDSSGRNGKSAIQIKAGQILTSAEELSNDVGTERKTVSRKLKMFEKHELISIARAYKGTLISVHHILEKCPRHDPRHGPSHDPRPAPAQTLVPQKKQRKPVHEMDHDMTHESVHDTTHILNKEKNKEKEGEGNAREARKNPPPFKSNSKLEDGIANESPIEDRNNLLPVEANEVCGLWHTRSLKRLSSKKFTLEEITASLVSITRETPRTWQDLLIMVKVLNVSDASIAQKFITPSQWDLDPFKDGVSYLDKAHALATSSPEGKALKKASYEKECEQKKEYRKPRIVDDYTPEEIEQRRLKRLEERRIWK